MSLDVQGEIRCEYESFALGGLRDDQDKDNNISNYFYKWATNYTKYNFIIRCFNVLNMTEFSYLHSVAGKLMINEL